MLLSVAFNTQNRSLLLILRIVLRANMQIIFFSDRIPKVNVTKHVHWKDHFHSVEQFHSSILIMHLISVHCFHQTNKTDEEIQWCVYSTFYDLFLALIIINHIQIKKDYRPICLAGRSTLPLIKEMLFDIYFNYSNDLLIHLDNSLMFTEGRSRYHF